METKDLVETLNEDLIETLSGVRGIWEKGLDDDVIRKYAGAYSNMLRERKSCTPIIALARDTRPSGKRIKSILEDYLECETIDLGTMPVQVMQHAIRTGRLDGGIYITASHNPLEYNGLKISRNDGGILDSDDTDSLKKRKNNLYDTSIKFKQKKYPVKDYASSGDPVDDYIKFVFDLIGEDAEERIRNYFSSSNERKVILDPNGGSACDILKKVMKRLGINYRIINKDFGNFGREIEPNKDTLEYLVSELKKEGDIAFGFDCDADRVEVVIPKGKGYTEEFGNVVNGQYLGGLMTDYFLRKLGKKAKGRYVVANDATSYLVKKIAEKFGAKFVEVGTGEINVVNKMLELDAVLSMEGSSSGIIHPETRCRDGILTMLYTLSIVSEKGKPLEKIINKLPKYYTLRDDEQSCDEKDLDRINKSIKKYYEDKKYTVLPLNDKFSGIKAVDKDGSWVWFRASATKKGQFRIFSDSKDKEKAKLLLEEGIRVFQAKKKRCKK